MLFFGICQSILGDLLFDHLCWHPYWGANSLNGDEEANTKSLVSLQGTWCRGCTYSAKCSSWSNTSIEVILAFKKEIVSVKALFDRYKHNESYHCNGIIAGSFWKHDFMRSL